MVVRKTKRLILRHWKPSDRPAFARMNADPRVMEYFPAPLTAEESDQLADRIEAHFRDHGFSMCAAELRDGGEFIGFVGLARPRLVAHFTPCVEIGWRLGREYWGRGLATEAAREMTRCAFGDLKLDEIVSFTVPANLHSRRVMEKLGMAHDDADDFDHPLLPEGHHLRRHVLYRLKREAWRADSRLQE
jgi:RimJ/RimL family protein N-acetyltransferase